MQYIPRLINNTVQQALARGKSLLLLGPRQTGKTTYIREQVRPDMSYSFAKPSVRLRYEQNPILLEKELSTELTQYSKPPVIFIDEVQKVPAVMDVAQYFIDNKQAQFILTGSSARKLIHGHNINLLPGRVSALTMTPLLSEEIPSSEQNIIDLLLYGSLPGIIAEKDLAMRESDLYSYVTTYLEEEIRAEALVRNIGSFARFLEIAASEAGKQLNYTRMSQDIGVAATTIAHYYQILEDCLITLRIDPITHSQTKRRLIKSPKYLFFDLGIRRACANEGTRLPQRTLADLFEHFIGNELIWLSQLTSPNIHVKYWRDSAGAEIDYVLDVAHHYVPIEVKWSDKPDEHDARHLKKFMTEYENVERAYIVCQTPKRYEILPGIMALPWQEMRYIFDFIPGRQPALA